MFHREPIIDSISGKVSSKMKPKLDHREKEALEKFKAQLFEELPQEILSLILFGSRARGEATAESDTDILVVTKTNDDYSITHKIEEVATRLLLETGVYISVKVINKHRFDYMNKLQAPFIENINKEGIPL